MYAQVENPTGRLSEVFPRIFPFIPFSYLVKSGIYRNDRFLPIIIKAGAVRSEVSDSDAFFGAGGSSMAESVKKSILLIPAYIGITACCIVVGELAYMMYFNTAHLVAGRPLELFSVYALARGFFIVVPAFIVLSPLFFSLYRIRHSGGGFLPVIVYILLCAVMWIVIFPLFIEFKWKTEQSSPPAPKTTLSSGYFRSYAGEAAYLLRDASAPERAAVVLKSTGDENAIGLAQVDTNVMEAESAPFADILIRETVPSFPAWIGSGIDTIEMHAEQAWKNGRFAWLCFLSLALALCSTYAVSFCSDWRFVGILYLLIMDAGVLSFNLLYYSEYFTRLREAGAQLANVLPFFARSGDPLLICINIGIAVLCASVGCLAAAVRAKRFKRAR